MYKPNTSYNKQFKEKHWKNRQIKTTVSVPCKTLDSCLKEADITPDFIKIDTQEVNIIF